MKKIGLFLTFSFLLASIMTAQDHRAELMERVESRKVAFLSDKLELSPDEAQVFWPLHNQYQEELHKIRGSKDRRKEFMMGNYDPEEALDELIKNEEKELALRKEYAYRFKDAIGARKTIMYYHFERKFKEEMLNELRKRRHEGPGRNR